MRCLLKVLILVLIGNICFSQASFSEGDILRKNGDLVTAIESYKADYKKFPSKWRNTYNLACSYALTFQKDSAFKYLNIALKYDTSLWALTDSDLYALIDDERWSKIENEQLQRFQEVNGSLKQLGYTRQLLNIILKDQSLDYFIKQGRVYFRENGDIPHWYYPLNAFKQQIGKDNYKTMQRLIEEYGWPKYSLVGKLAADAPLLVINHHENDSVRKKYLDKIKQSCLEKEGSCLEYAKIQDRILVNDNKLQIYGMQFRYTSKRKLEPFPIKDPEYVDERRKKIGLEPLKDYLIRKIDYDWNVIQKTKI